MNHAIKIYLQSKGNRVAILLEGEKGIVEQIFWSFDNWGAAISELQETGKENRFYFWTSPKKLLHYYENILEHKFYLLCGYEPCEKCKQLIPKLARQKIEKIEYQNFLPRSTRSYYEINI